MTIIKPYADKTFINKILMLVIGFLVLSAFWLVIIYNRAVNLTHSISQTKDNVEKLQTANAELKDKMFSLFKNDNLAAFTNNKQLIQDRAPQYLEVDERWSLAASRY